MINNSASIDKSSSILSSKDAFKLLRSLSKDKLLDADHIHCFNNLNIVDNNGR